MAGIPRGALALGLMGLLVSGASGQYQVPRPDLATELEKRVESMEARIAKLEKELAKWQAIKVVPIPPSLRPTQPQERMPGWELREFNGMRYYLVPLDQNPSPPAAPRR